MILLTPLGFASSDLGSLITEDGIGLSSSSHPIGKQGRVVPIQHMLDVVSEGLEEDLFVSNALVEDPIKLESPLPLVKYMGAIFYSQVRSSNIDDLSRAILLLECLHQLICYRALALEDPHALVFLAFMFI